MWHDVYLKLCQMWKTLSSQYKDFPSCSVLGLPAKLCGEYVHTKPPKKLENEDQHMKTMFLHRYLRKMCWPVSPTEMDKPALLTYRISAEKA